MVWCNSPLQKVSRHLNFQGSSTLPKVLGGSVMTLESCRGVDALEMVTPFQIWPFLVCEKTMGCSIKNFCIFEAKSSCVLICKNI